MPTHTVSKNRKTTWEVDESGDTWVLEKGATIKIADGAAIFEDQSFSGNLIKVLGDIVTAGNSSGVNVQGLAQGSRVIIGQDCTILSRYAIYAAADDQRFTNNGELFGTDFGIESSGANTVITNNGIIFGGTGISMDGANLTIVNGRSGRIDGLPAIAAASDDQVRIINKGLISSGGEAIRINDGLLQDGSSHITNSGTIFGLVYLGTGDDIFDTRKGTVDSFVLGGDGDDEYVVPGTGIGLFEYAGEGNDTVRSTGSHDLKENFENLILLGGKNIDGEGNGDGNILTGNIGKNTLLGEGGIDIINGGMGNDTLDGSDDNVLDLYAFARGTGDDVVVTFEDGVDLISLASYDGVEDIGDLSVTQDGADTLMVLLDGDSVRIKNFSATDFTGADIAFEVF